MKNIILSFLSPVRIKRETGLIDYKSYPGLDSDNLGDTWTTNESGLRYIMQELKKSSERLDYYICLTSKTVLEKKPGVSGMEDYTHFQIFEHRAAEIFKTYYSIDDNSAEKMIRCCDYKEGGIIDTSLVPLQKVVKLVRSLSADKADNEKIFLHLDLTGGPRDANMILLLITRLLEYEEDIVVGQVVYSALSGDVGHVQVISEAYTLLDLVAGIAEFANFGSMRSLNKFFEAAGGVKDKDLACLLQKMNDFSDKIRLCRYGELTGAIENLQDMLKEIAIKLETADVYKEKVIMELFVKEINKQYSDLFAAVNEEDTRLKDVKLIKWCINNDCVQQAMTLVTERVPFILYNGDKGLFLLSDDEKKLNDLNEKFDSYVKNTVFKAPDFAYWLLNIDSFSNRWEKNIVEKKLNVMAGYILKRLGKKAYDEALDYYDKKIEEIVEHMGLNIAVKADIGRKNMEEFSEELKKCFADKEYRAGGYIADELYRRTELKKMQFIMSQIVKSRIGGEKNYSWLNIFGENFVEENSLYPRNLNSIISRLDMGYLKTNCDKALLKSILCDYFLIRNERNTVNHAHDEKEKITFSEIKAIVNRLADNLEAGLNESGRMGS